MAGVWRMERQFPFARMELLYGPEAMETLRKSRVLLLGVGGVGGHCAEALCRCGIERFFLVDGDRVAETNLNRQLVALTSTLGQEKVRVMRARMLDINPRAEVGILPAFYRPGELSQMWDFAPDILVDAIDDVPAKVDLACEAEGRGILAVSCMGAGNKKDPMGFVAADLYDTAECPLCRAVRKQARRKGVGRLRVVYSRETPARRQGAEGEGPAPGSVAFVTAAAGLMLASETVKMLLSQEVCS